MIGKQQIKPTNRLVKSAKNNFIKEKLNNYRNNPKKFWEQIKSTFPSDRSQNPIKLTDNEGNILNNVQTATLINAYFTNIVTLSAKTSLMLGVHKAGFRREGHNYRS